MIDLWTKRRLEETSGKATTAMTRMAERFERTAIVPQGAPPDAKAWGQYLDDEHHSDRQWGFYGTSAAINTLTIKELDTADPRPADDPLIKAGSAFLPTNPATTEAHFASKRAKGDFDNIIKLAFIADGLVPWMDNVPVADTPEVVRAILSRSVNNRFWSSRMGNDPAREHKERLFPTAYIVMVLQRYEEARRHAAYIAARKWLAERVKDNKVDTPATNALIGLALLDPHEKPENRIGAIDSALKTCQTRLIRWGRTQKVIIIDRPVFYGFSIGDRNSYSFLNPEILAALFLLKRGNPHRGRRFVLGVINALADNTVDGGFTGQNGVMSAVDQMWASRLLGRFLTVKDEPGGITRLLPVRDQRAFLVDTRSRIVAVVALAVAALGVVALTAENGLSMKSIGAWVAAVLLLLANPFVMPGKDDEV
jgi:hypothetical protein